MSAGTAVGRQLRVVPPLSPAFASLTVAPMLRRADMVFLTPRRASVHETYISNSPVSPTFNIVIRKHIEVLIRRLRLSLEDHNRTILHQVAPEVSPIRPVSTSGNDLITKGMSKTGTGIVNTLRTLLTTTVADEPQNIVSVRVTARRVFFSKLETTRSPSSGWAASGTLSLARDEFKGRSRRRAAGETDGPKSLLAALVFLSNVRQAIPVRVQQLICSTLARRRIQTKAGLPSVGRPTEVDAVTSLLRPGPAGVALIQRVFHHALTTSNGSAVPGAARRRPSDDRRQKASMSQRTPRSAADVGTRPARPVDLVYSRASAAPLDVHRKSAPGSRAAKSEPATINIEEVSRSVIRRIDKQLRIERQRSGLG